MTVSGREQRPEPRARPGRPSQGPAAVGRLQRPRRRPRLLRGSAESLGSAENLPETWACLRLRLPASGAAEENAPLGTLVMNSLNRFLRFTFA